MSETDTAIPSGVGDVFEFLKFNLNKVCAAIAPKKMIFLVPSGAQDGARGRSRGNDGSFIEKSQTHLAVSAVSAHWTDRVD